jgi:exopolyphosphatase / guanosine-5'-triphosphate,3'-diphosphate pyrophosphatase
MKAAVIDVGFNSLKMLKYIIEPDGTSKPYGQLGMLAKLGEGLESTGYLGAEPMSRTIDAIRLCRENATLEAVKHVLLIGTSPVREAANREEFLRRVQEETGLRMRVLTGNEEALYGLLGASTSVGEPTALYFDLGGGSLELSLIEKFRIKRILSLPIGSLKLTSSYAGKDGRFSKKNRSRMRKKILQALPSRKELGLPKDAVLVGTGGTVRALARFQQDSDGYPLNKIHNYPIRTESVERMSREFLKLKISQLDKIDAIGVGRSETITAGTLIVRLLMERLGFDRVVVSTHGVRDGILAEFLESGARPQSVGLKDQIEKLMAPPGPPPGLAACVEVLDCMERNGFIDSRERTVLLTAVERGRAPDEVDSDPDALFWVIMGEDLPMDHEMQTLMAVSLVKARRSRTANWLMRRYSSMLPHDPKVVKKLGATIRLLEILERSSAQIQVAYSKGLRISIAESKGPFPLELARTAALGLSASLRTPVTIFASSKERERHAGLVKEARV